MKLIFEVSGPLAEAMTLCADFAAKDFPEEQHRVMLIQSALAQIIGAVGAGAAGDIPEDLEQRMIEVHDRWAESFDRMDPTTWGVREVTPSDEDYPRGK